MDLLLWTIVSTIFIQEILCQDNAGQIPAPYNNPQFQVGQESYQVPQVASGSRFMSPNVGPQGQGEGYPPYYPYYYTPIRYYPVVYYKYWNQAPYLLDTSFRKSEHEPHVPQNRIQFDDEDYTESQDNNGDKNHNGENDSGRPHTRFDAHDITQKPHTRKFRSRHNNHNRDNEDTQEKKLDETIEAFQIQSRIGVNPSTAPQGGSHGTPRGSSGGPQGTHVSKPEPRSDVEEKNPSLLRILVDGLEKVVDDVKVVADEFAKNDEDTSPISARGLFNTVGDVMESGGELLRSGLGVINPALKMLTNGPSTLVSSAANLLTGGPKTEGPTSKSSSPKNTLFNNPVSRFLNPGGNSNASPQGNNIANMMSIATNLMSSATKNIGAPILQRFLNPGSGTDPANRLGFAVNASAVGGPIFKLLIDLLSLIFNFLFAPLKFMLGGPLFGGLGGGLFG